MTATLVLDELDPLTGELRPWNFKGWPDWVAHCKRLKAECPWMLRNSVQWRLEKMEAGPWPPDVLDRSVAKAQTLVALALAHLVLEERM